jgi:hypothetical protein
MGGWSTEKTFPSPIFFYSGPLKGAHLSFFRISYSSYSSSSRKNIARCRRMIHFYEHFFTGEMAEWFKAHAWKA